MTDAPEQTPLVRRINSRHAVQCRLLENVRGGYGYTGTCNCGAAEDADEVAALEQDRRDLLERLGIAWARSKTENEELARLREAIGEIVDEIEEGAGMVHALTRPRALKQGGNSD
jgi:hypothetical protein